MLFILKNQVRRYYFERSAVRPTPTPSRIYVTVHDKRQFWKHCFIYLREPENNDRKLSLKDATSENTNLRISTRTKNISNVSVRQTAPYHIMISTTRSMFFVEHCQQVKIARRTACTRKQRCRYSTMDTDERVLFGKNHNIL